MELPSLPFVVIFSSCLHLCKTTLHGFVDDLELDLEVGYSAVALGCGHLAMPQEVLDDVAASALRSCVAMVPKPMTRRSSPLRAFVFDSLLDPSDRSGVPHYMAPYAPIILLLSMITGKSSPRKGRAGIFTHDRPSPSHLPMGNKVCFSIVYAVRSELGRLLNQKKPAAQHHHERGRIHP